MGEAHHSFPSAWLVQALLSTGCAGPRPLTGGKEPSRRASRPRLSSRRSCKAKGVLVVLGAVNVKVQGGVVQLTQGDLAGPGSEKLL